MKGLHFHLFLVITMTVVASISAATPEAPVAGGGGALADECSKDFQKVTLCLDFATGKAPNPSKKCCDAIQDTKEKDPKCLCFVIQQAKTGGQALKDLGVQEEKLIQLPTACQLQNASISNCPKLLGISPSSPDAAVFTNSSTATTTTTPTAPAGKSPATPATATNTGGSASIRDGHTILSLAVALMTISFVVSTLPMMDLA